MKRNLIVIAAVALLTIPVLSSAEPFKPGAYFSVFLGGGVLQNTDATTTDIGVQDIRDRIEFDPGINVGVTGGYDLGLFRLEGELSYKQGEISSVRDNLGNTFIRTDGSLGALSMLFNGFFNLRNDSPVTPYLGGGIGFATLHLSDTDGIQSTTGTKFRLYNGDSDTVLAYQLGAGMAISLSRLLSVDLGYRYFATDVARFETGGNKETSLKYQSHNGTVGLRVKF